MIKYGTALKWRDRDSAVERSIIKSNITSYSLHPPLRWR